MHPEERPSNNGKNQEEQDLGKLDIGIWKAIANNWDEWYVFPKQASMWNHK